MFSWMSGDFIKREWYLTIGSMASYKGLFSKVLNSIEMSVKHRSGSIQGTDHIANYFFLNLKVFRAKIENPK